MLLGPVLALAVVVLLGTDDKVSSPGAMQFVDDLWPGSDRNDTLIAPEVNPWTDGDLSRCREVVRHLREVPALPGTPSLDENRAALLARHKAEPVIFLRPPEYEPSEDAVVRAHRRRLERTRFPADVIAQSITRYQYRPDLGRQVLLREGYLYAESESHLRGILAHLRAEHMFDAPRIWIQRGGRTLSASRDPKTGSYRHDEGPNEGQDVRILPFDRIVGSPDELREPLHRELRVLRNRLGFDQMRIDRITREGIIADLRYDNLWVTTVLDGTGPQLEAACEVVQPAQEGKLRQARAEATRRLELVHALRLVALAQANEGLPFDEPKTEYGQQDGKLRPRWEQAYDRGQKGFTYQGDWYPVFTPDGRAKVPQVCLDFLLDTLERAGGSWWNPASGPRQRTIGRFDRAALGLANPRSIDHFVQFAATHPDKVDLWTVPPAERIEFQHERRFLDFLAAHADDFRAGDIVLIKGYLPRPGDRRHDIMHYHSVYVYETDPVTGVPMLLIGNSGVPRLTTWRFEMDRTPRRAVYYRIRPKTEWLASFVVDQGGSCFEPAPLVTAGPRGMQ